MSYLHPTPLEQQFINLLVGMGAPDRAIENNLNRMVEVARGYAEQRIKMERARWNDEPLPGGGLDDARPNP